MDERRDRLSPLRSLLSKLLVATATLAVLGVGALAPAQAATSPDPSDDLSVSAAATATPVPEDTASAPAVPAPTEESAPERAPGSEPAPVPQDATVPPSPEESPDASPSPSTEAPDDQPAEDAPAAPAEEDGAVVPFVVPPATGTNAVISVKVGGDRTSPVAVGPLAGVTLQLYTDGSEPGAALTDPWATCISDADGDCSFIVPQTQFGGANFNRRFWIQQTGVPAGWYANPTLGTGSDGETPTPYQFRTGPALVAGTTYTSQGAFMLSTGNTNPRASGGIWQSSRTNPTFPAQCGIDVALILDLSGSVAPSLADLKTAANGFVDALTGTPSSVALFTFSSLAPAAGNPNLAATPVSTAASAETVKSQINSYTASGGTNWDRGIYQVASDPAGYDVAVVITDGNPTFYGNQEGPGGYTRLRETENGIFSANAVKAQGTHMLAVGVGSGVSSAGSGLNLRAISGTTLGTDYFQAADYEDAEEELRALALGNCAGTVTVVKQTVPSTTPVGSTAGAEPAGGWDFTATTTSPGVSVDAPGTATTAAGTGAANFALTFAGGVTSGNVSLTETLIGGFTLHQVNGFNAVCTDVATGANIPVTNDGTTGFTVAATSTGSVSCDVYNRAPAETASLTLSKQWVVNGTTYADGQQPEGLDASATIDGTDQGWGVPRTGFQIPTSPTIAETTAVNLTQCTLDSSRATSFNGAAQDEALPYSPALVAGSNTATITNTVTCDTRLTLEKIVQGGPAAPTAWDLEAFAPTGSLPGPAGTTGSAAATASVTPGATYALAESGGDPNYAQVVGPNAVLIPRSSGTWLCVQVAADGTTVIPGFADGLNGGVTVPLGTWIRCSAVNQGATLDLRKVVENAWGGEAIPSDWVLTATPIGPAPAGVVAQSVQGSSTSGLLTVRPGVTYELTESGTPSGYLNRGIICDAPVPGQAVTTILLEAVDIVVCTITNVDQPGRLTLIKDVVNDDGGQADPTAWTLSADGPTTGLSGVTGDPAVTSAEVIAGTYALSEDGGPVGYDAGQWTCEAPATGTTEAVPVPVVDSSVTVALGQAVVCRIVNDDRPGTFAVVKTSAPGDGQTVTPGSLITYTVTARKTNDGADPGVVVTDDLTRVLDNASLVPGSITASLGTATLTGSSLVWDVGPLADAATLTYQVLVSADAAGATLVNVVTSPGVDPCLPPGTVDTLPVTALVAAAVVVDPDEWCRTTTHPVPAAPRTAVMGTYGWSSRSSSPTAFAPTGSDSLPLGLGALLLVGAGALVMGIRRRRS
ncbi:VWA domain-containing protein [Sanguibacter suarezii]|uniref:DUF7927 domain-containing protein n=1 Tax=Sanguibacter suarezii TaxID=60921 RepID=UPI00082DC316|nr:VWA domain-containing protein [Sanguibacter suarezii]